MSTEHETGQFHVMSIQRQFSGGVAWMAFGNWTEQAVNFLIFVILARLLGAEAFGLLAMATVFVVLSEFLVRETLSEALISLPDLRPDHLNSTFWLLAMFGGGVTAVLVVGAWAIGWIYGEPRIVPIMQALALTVPMIALTAVPVGLLRREMRFRILSLRAIAGVVAGGVVGIAMAVAGAGVWALVGQRLVQVGVNIVLAWGAVDWRPARKFDKQAATEVGQFGGQVIALRAGEIALTQIPILVVGAVAGPIATGLYAMAWRIVDLAAVLIAMPLRQASQPAFAAISREGGDAVEFLLRLTALAGWIAFPAFAGLAILAEPFLMTVFGQKWLDAAPVLSALAMLGAYLSIEKQHQSFVLAAGNARSIAAMTWIEAGIAAIAIWLILPYGLAWAAGAQVAILYALWPIRFAILGRLSDRRWREFTVPHIWPVLGSSFMGIMVWMIVTRLEDDTFLQLVTGSLAGSATYLGFTLIFQKDRLKLARSFIR